MGEGFRGINPVGLSRLAEELSRRGDDVAGRRRIVAGILRSAAHPEAAELYSRLSLVEVWARDEAANLHWRAEAIAEGQRLAPGCGVPEVYVTGAHDRALIAAFLPSRFDLEAWSRQWAVIRTRRVGRELAGRYLNGEDVSDELIGFSHRPGYEAAAAAFFNTLGVDLTASIPQNVRISALQAGENPDDPAAIMRRYARAFAAATRSGELEFTVEDLFGMADPAAQLRDGFAAAHLMTEPGIDPSWLEYAGRNIVLGKAYIPWVTSPDAVAAIATGLTNNPEVAVGVLAEPGAVEALLRRSTLFGDGDASTIGDALEAAVAAATDRAVAARIGSATILAIGGAGTQPHRGMMPQVAIVGGTYLDEIAWSLVAWDHDPTYQPRFEVERGVARRFLLETVRDTEAYALLLGAAQVWISNVTAADGPTTFADYTRKVNNRADDIGMLLATIIGADRISGIESAEEQARRRAMLLDAIGGVAGIAASLTGPGAVVLRSAADLLTDRAADTLSTDPVVVAASENDAFREAVLDELRAALHEIIVDLELEGPDAQLDPQTLAEQQGAVMLQILTAIYATMSQFEPEEFT